MAGLASTPTTSYKSFLMKYSDGRAATKLIDIKNVPKLGGEPEMVETTTLSNKMRTYVPGIQSVDKLEFTANYTKTDYDTVAALEGQEMEFGVWFGGTGEGSSLQPTGSEGKWKFKGQLSVHIGEMGVNDVRDMIITIAPSSDIEVDAGV